jgi:hypothetical protein
VSRFRALAFDQVQMEQGGGFAIEKEKEDIILKKLAQ